MLPGSAVAAMHVALQMQPAISCLWLALRCRDSPTCAWVAGLLPLRPLRPLELGLELVLRKREGSKLDGSAEEPCTCRPHAGTHAQAMHLAQPVCVIASDRSFHPWHGDCSSA